MGRVLFATYLVTGIGLAGCGDDTGPAVDGGACTSASDCDDGVFCNGAESCDPTSSAAGANGCVPGAPPCQASQSCDEGADQCSSDCAMAPDADSDGRNAVECGGDDCDDSNPDIFPGASEVCDAAGVDEDCDPMTIGDRDVDGDGRIDAACCNGDTCGDDCNDMAAAINPMGTEACDQIDNDCDTFTDEGVQAALWPDVDRDMFGDADAVPVMGCPALMPDRATNGDDCDDAVAARNPGETEICDDGVWDNNCDGVSPFDRDADQADDIVCGGTDCNDMDNTITPGAAELCDSIDQDCDGAASDDDGDGLLATTDMCSGGPLDVPMAMRTDCDDRALIGRFAFPGATEICDGVDNDCDSMFDEAGFVEPNNTGPTVEFGPTDFRDPTFCSATAPVGGAMVPVVFNMRDSSDTPVTNTNFEVFPSNEVSACPGPGCIQATTDIFGQATVMLRAGSWFAARVPPTTTLLERVEFNQPVPDSPPYQYGVGGVRLADVEASRAQLMLPSLTTTGILEAEFEDCNGRRVRGAYLRLYDMTSTPVCGIYAYLTDTGLSLSQRDTGESGKAFTFDIPAAVGGTRYFVEFWTYDPMTMTKVLRARELVEIRRNALTFIKIGPLRSDGPTR